MHIRHAAVFLAIALLSASAVSDEPVIIALAIEPEVETPAPTLESAARANDFPTFDALYRAQPDPAFRTLHELWTYSMTDRVGAFYGAEMYEKLSRDYPAYAEFIAPHRIVDRNGQVFYPASETRAFLLELAAERRLPARRPAAVASAELVEPAAVERRRIERGDAAAPRPAVTAPPAPVAAPAAAPAPAPQEEPLAPLTTVAREPAPAAAAPAPLASVAEPVQAAAPPATTNRGLLLIILGLVGVGLLALILRAPREVIP